MKERRNFKTSAAARDPTFVAVTASRKVSLVVTSLVAR